MTFVIPAPINNHQVSPTTNTKYNSTENSPTGSGTKPNGSLPLTNNAGDWKRVPNTSTEDCGYAYNFNDNQSGHDVSTDTKLLVWHTQSNSSNSIQKDTVANRGTSITLFSGIGTPSAIYRRWYIGGNDTPMAASISGPLSFVIDLNDTTYNSSNGAWDNTNVTTYAIWGKPFSMIDSNRNMWCFETPAYLFDTSKGSVNTPTFSGTNTSISDCSDLVQGSDYSNKLGNWVKRSGSIIFIDVGFRIGNQTSLTNFTDDGFTVLSTFSNNSDDPRNRLSTQACRVYLNLRNNSSDTATFTGKWQWGTRAPFDFNQSDDAVVTLANPTFWGMGEFTLGSSVSGSAIWINVDSVILSNQNINIDGSIFTKTHGNYALQITAGSMNIADMTFTKYANKHAILINTAGTYNFDNVIFDQSGTNDIENTSNGLVIINILNKGTIPTITNTGEGSTTTVNNFVPVSVHVNDIKSLSNISGARVLLTADDGGLLPFKTPITISNNDNVLYMIGSATDYLSTIDTITGSATRVGNTNQFGIGETNPQGLAFVGNTLYMISGGVDYLSTLDLSTGAATRVGSSIRFGIEENVPQGLATVGNTLYMVGGSTDYLTTIDITTGIATRIGNVSQFGIGESNPQGLATIGNTLYMIGGSTDYLSTVDTTTGIATRVGNSTRFGINEFNPLGLAGIGNILYMVGSVNNYLTTLDLSTGAATRVGSSTQFGIGENFPSGLAATTPSITVTHAGHKLLNGNKVEVMGANQATYNGIKTITNITANTYDFNISDGTDAATGNITSTAVILDGISDTDGDIATDIFNFVSIQPVLGRVRNASSSPYYKPVELSGNIIDTGVTVTASMALDQ